MNRAFIMLAMLAVLTGCSGGDEQLGDGYMFVKTDSHNHYIVKGPSSTVDSNVAEYQVTENFVLGLRTKPERPEVGKYRVSNAYGYFVLDKRTGDLEEGLSREQLVLRAAELKIALDLD
jgi:hypothetical protein